MFVVYGIAYFISPHMKNEFRRFGLEKIGLLTAILEFIYFLQNNIFIENVKLRHNRCILLSPSFAAKVGPFQHW